MASLTNDEIQQNLQKALKIISEAKTVETDEFALAKLEVLHSSLTLVKMVAYSSNGIPCLRGMGIEKAYNTALAINTASTAQAKFLHFNFKELMESVTIEIPAPKTRK
jgi:hypothetical protein